MARELARPEAELLRWFDSGHLPAVCREVSALFGDLARKLPTILPADAETTTAIRKLLEAKDCAVRATLAGRDNS